MKYSDTFTAKNGAEILIRNGTYSDGSAMRELYVRTHTETDYLLSYPDENTRDADLEGRLLDAKAESEKEVELIAFVDGKAVGAAGVSAVGTKYKVAHRAEFGICVLKEYWGLGIGRALTEACIRCAKSVGYAQLELEVAANNERAAAMYKKAGFTEYGRNPKGFNSRISGFTELVSMRLEL